MQAFVIGGYWRFIEQTMLSLFAEYGFSVDERHHVSKERGFAGPIPADVQVVIVLSEMIAGSSRATALAKKLAADRGLPCIVGSRHKSLLRPVIESFGFKRVLSPANAEAIVAEENTVTKTPSQQGTAPDLSNLSFEQLFSQLKVVIRTLRDKHAVQEVMWSRETGLEIKRTEVRNTDLDT